ncbi:polysaccharide deacetylase family protein [Muricoccus radiodurans]|uniref:polysaccharide deacetylase family protein n=1 Tax=Muricoccus radiodurans TaxID=2231721 RepID=UPI003CFB8355
MNVAEPPPASKRGGGRVCVFADLPELVTFTADVERSPTDPTGRRHGPATRRMLDLLDETGARGTFFVLGEVADSMPGLVREIAARGHEVASHGQRHLPLEALSPALLREEASRARRVLEDLTGAAVTGFRAPYFSLTAETEWAPDALAEAGYAYSSSVLPAQCFLHGHAGVPARPFAWPCGLLELPVPVARIWGHRVPMLGGMYLRYLPPFDVPIMIRRLEGPLVWTYCHPYDLDTEEPFTWDREIGLTRSLFLRMNRRITLRRLRALHAGRLSIPLAERLAEARAHAGGGAPAPQSNGSAEEATVVSEL